jgi:hypothetical protein
VLNRYLVQMRRCEMQRCDGLNSITWGQVHMEGRPMPWLLTGHVSLCLEDIQKARGRMRFLLSTFLTQVCTSFGHLIWTATKTENTEHIKYPEHELNAVNPNKRTTQLAWKSSAGSPTQEQPQHPTASLSEYDVNEGSSKYHAKEAAPFSSSEGEVARLENERFMELKRQLLVSLAAQTERDKRIAQLTDELALKSSLLEQAEANAVETAKRAGLELDRPLMQTSMVNQNGLVDMQAKLEELPLSPSRDQQFGKKLANIRAKLEAKESELEAIRLRLTDAEKGWTKSKVEADTLRAEIAAGLVSTGEDRIMRRLTERMRVMVEAEMASLRRKEKSRESI